MDKVKKNEVIIEHHALPDARHITYTNPSSNSSNTSFRLNGIVLIGILTLLLVIAGMYFSL